MLVSGDGWRGFAVPREGDSHCDPVLTRQN